MCQSFFVWWSNSYWISLFFSYSNCFSSRVFTLMSRDASNPTLSLTTLNFLCAFKLFISHYLGLYIPWISNYARDYLSYNECVLLCPLVNIDDVDLLKAVLFILFSCFSYKSLLFCVSTKFSVFCWLKFANVHDYERSY